MTLVKKLEMVQFIIDPQGEKQAAIVDLSTWEELLSLARSIELSAHTPITGSVNIQTSPATPSTPGKEWEDNLTLEELVARITPENIHSETTTGQPVGDEVW